MLQQLESNRNKINSYQTALGINIELWLIFFAEFIQDWGTKRCIFTSWITFAIVCQCLFAGIENLECGLTAILTHWAVKAEKQNAQRRKEITRQDYLLCFPLDALSEVIGLGITLITALLINRWGLYWFHWSAGPGSHHPKQWWM